MRRSLALVLTAVVIGAGFASSHVGAKALPRVTKKAPLRCEKVTKSGKAFRFCVGSITSKDRTVLLDADVTLPARGDGPFPLVVLLHGLGGSKLSFESDTIQGDGGSTHFNNLWFASKGYAVLTHTARGYKGSSCIDTAVESIDGNLDLYDPSPACRPQIVNQAYDVKDTQQLISGLVDDTLLTTEATIDSKKIGVAGVSLGGGQTWLLTRKNTWKTPAGTAVKLAAAVPIIGWTDLVDALLPNGGARDDAVQSTAIAERQAERVGVPKTSYIGALYSLAQITSSDFKLPGFLNAWYARFNAGEPFDDEVSLDAVHKLLTNHSAYYLDKKGSFFTPTFAVQGFTDILFNAQQPLRMYNRYVSDPAFKFSAYFGDWGHPMSQNKDAETLFIFNRVTAWLDYYLKGKGADPAKRFEARITLCGTDDIGDLYKATTWSGLQEARDDFSFDLAGDISTESSDPHASLIDPINEPRNTCRTTDTAVAEGNLAAEMDFPDGYTMIGMSDVRLDADPTAPNMYISARLWDVDPEAGTQTLVDRGVFRLGGEEAQAQIDFELFGNGWTFAPGHKMKLEFTANDAPAFGNPNAVGTIAISGVSISLPKAAASAKLP
ncbi:MAG: type transport system ATP-binding protein [Actinomycetota bacterium]|jgi:predicted acyl esterase|nr:type transport system ATP-binding protein [Actinomycetota bacterium]